MNEFLSILIGVVVIANLAFTIWSFFSLRRHIKLSRSAKLKDDFLLEHIVYTRSSINLVYASIAIVSFVLAFLGFNLKDKVSQDVTKEISASARVDLNILKDKVSEIATLDSSAVLKYKELNLIADKSRSVLNELNRYPQKVYVVQGLKVSPQKHYFDYSELQTVDGDKLPKFSRRPATLKSEAYSDQGPQGERVTTDTKDGVDFGVDQGTFEIDLFIFPVK